VVGNRIIHRVFALRVFNDHTRTKLLVSHGKKKTHNIENRENIISMLAQD